MKNCLDGKRYLVIPRQAFFKPNSDETLLAENQIECYGVKVYLRPRVFGGKKIVEDRYQVGRSIKIVISWYGSTRYLDVCWEKTGRLQAWAPTSSAPLEQISTSSWTPHS